MVAEPIGDAPSVLVVPGDPELERLQSPPQEESRERVERGSEVALRVDPFHERGRPYDRTGQEIGVAAEVLGRAVDDEVRPEGERGLVDRGRERIVDEEHRADPMDRFSPTPEVVDREQWVGRALDDREARVAAHDRFGRAGLAFGDLPHPHAVARKQVGEEVGRPAVQPVKGHDLVPRAEQR